MRKFVGLNFDSGNPEKILFNKEYVVSVELHHNHKSSNGEPYTVLIQLMDQRYIATHFEDREKALLLYDTMTKEMTE